MEKGRIAKLKSYLDAKYYHEHIRWLILDADGKNVSCDKCGNFANGIMKAEKRFGTYNIPLCKKHIGEFFPHVKSVPCVVKYEKPLTKWERSWVEIIT